MEDSIGNLIHITGVVQGVGFRPFIYGLAKQQNLTGWVKNTSAGVEIYIESDQTRLDLFLGAIRKNSPPLAKIDSILVKPAQLYGCDSFEIIQSQSLPNAFQPIAPDVSICQDCLHELFDPTDRRYLYPFINCTNCGPRFTIIKNIPYDRPYTTMADFKMCPECNQEYSDPENRRFHAQPIACEQCGPHIWLEYPKRHPSIDNQLEHKDTISTIIKARELLQGGKIVAIKGLGGFHLACDALNTNAVDRLRTRKLRVEKPFAIMMFSIEQVEKHCYLNNMERSLISSVQRPIVILERREESLISKAVAPNQDTLGVMLPYTPLHYLLLADPSKLDIENNKFGGNEPSVLVMTSGNLIEEPIATDNQEALEQLSGIADAFLMHNRPIYLRCDDSVIQTINFDPNPVQNSPKLNSPETKTSRNSTTTPTNNIYHLRRSRGFAPYPISLAKNTSPILAVGAELKNTFCITRDNYAFISQHIGDLENYETFQSFENGIKHFERIFRIQPEFIAYDLHPDYLSTRYATERAMLENLNCIGIQHHHAHIASCMIDNQLSDDDKVIGVAFDGTGYGSDGAIWGGEFLLSNYTSYKRVAHLAYIPLPGGDTAIHKPARIALAYLWQAGIEWESNLSSVKYLSDQELQAVHFQLENRFNAPATSSMGRLFDAVAAMIGVRQEINYEAQAAIELEALATKDSVGWYNFGYTNERNETSDHTFYIDPNPVIQSIYEDVQRGVITSTISARFHEGIAKMVVEVCSKIRVSHGTDKVVLSGGVWQNLTLLYKTIVRLNQSGFIPYTHHQVPTNDGGISLGQAVIAAYSVED